MSAMTLLALAGRADRAHARRRRAPEPRRRQPLLARPLRRARRRHGASPALGPGAARRRGERQRGPRAADPAQPRSRRTPGSRTTSSHPISRPTRRCASARCSTSCARDAPPRVLRADARLAQRLRLDLARPDLARHLARPESTRRTTCRRATAVRALTLTERDRAHEPAGARDGRLQRSQPREHDARPGLALHRPRPPPRARALSHHALPAHHGGALPRRDAPPRGAARDLRQRDHLSRRRYLGTVQPAPVLDLLGDRRDQPARARLPGARARGARRAPAARRRRGAPHRGGTDGDRGAGAAPAWRCRPSSPRSGCTASASQLADLPRTADRGARDALRHHHRRAISATPPRRARSAATAPEAPA